MPGEVLDYIATDDSEVVLGAENKEGGYDFEWRVVVVLVVISVQVE